MGRKWTGTFQHVAFIPHTNRCVSISVIETCALVTQQIMLRVLVQLQIWDITPCSLMELYWHFRRSYFYPKTWAAESSETTAHFHQNTWRHIPEDWPLECGCEWLVSLQVRQLNVWLAHVNKSHRTFSKTIARLKCWSPFRDGQVIHVLLWSWNKPSSSLGALAVTESCSVLWQALSIKKLNNVLVWKYSL